MKRYKVIIIKYQGAIGYLIALGDVIQQIRGFAMHLDLQELVGMLQTSGNLRRSTILVPYVMLNYDAEVIGELTVDELAALPTSHPELYI